MGLKVRLDDPGERLGRFLEELAQELVRDELAQAVEELDLGGGVEEDDAQRTAPRTLGRAEVEVELAILVPAQYSEKEGATDGYIFSRRRPGPPPQHTTTYLALCSPYPDGSRAYGHAHRWGVSPFGSSWSSSYPLILRFFYDIAHMQMYGGRSRKTPGPAQRRRNVWRGQPGRQAV